MSCKRRGRGLVAFLLLLWAIPAAAQDGDRSLHWAEWNVVARLDSAGRLHVREHVAPVFAGAWNGGSRRFRTRFGQDLRFEGMARLPTPGGEPVPMARGDLDELHRWNFVEGELRWRSRPADAPPFAGERLDYVLDYVVDNAVLPTDDGYVLDWAFLPADREGPVERFAVELTLDEPWRAVGTGAGPWTATDIAHDLGFVVRVPLRYAAAGRPATVPPATPPWLRALLALAVLAGAVLLFLRFRRREEAAGRYAPLTPPNEIDGAWLERHVLHLPAEVVGAAWDRSTGAAEVAGMLARLVAEGKLRSRVEAGEPGDDPVLHLELTAGRDVFTEDERPLIDALFWDGRTQTSTAAVKDHYEGSGFDPAGKIRAGLDRRIALLPGGGRVPHRWLGPVLLTVGGAACMAVGAVLRPPDGALALGIGLPALLVAAIAVGIAAVYARRVVGLGGAMAGFAGTLAVALLWVLLGLAGVFETTSPASSVASPYYRAGAVVLLGLAVFALGLVALVLEAARPVETPERLTFRRRLAAARSWMEAELDSPTPALADRWYPYLLAFGLGERVDRWFEAFGPTARGATHVPDGTGAAGMATAAAAAGGGWTGGGSLFGGGGGFAGGGVGRSWTSAATGIASGVAAPSSSGGGVSGGGASAGGGSAGGW